MERIAFVAEMIDRISSPAKRVASAMGAMKSESERVANSFKQVGKKLWFGDQGRNELGHFTNRVGGLRKAFDLAGKGISTVASVAKGAFAIGGTVAAAGGLVAKFAAETMVDALTFQQSTKAAFGAMEGSQTAGAMLYDHILGMSKHFRQNPREMMKSVMALRTAGLSTQQALSVIQSGMDLKTLTPEANLEALARAIGQIKGKGKLEAEELNQLAESGGLAKDSVYKALLAIKGLDAAKPDSIDKLQKMLREGKVSADEAIPAIQKAIATMTGTTKAGEYADKARNSVGALLQGLKAAPDQFLLRMSVDDGPLQKLLLMLNEFFDPTTERGQRLMTMLNKIGAQIMAIFGKMGTSENMERLEKFIVNLIKLLPIMVSAFALALDIFITVFDALANLGDNFRYVWRESAALRAILVGLALVMSPLLIIGTLLTALVLLPIVAIGAAIYGLYKLMSMFWNWLKNSSFGEAIGGLFSGLLTVLQTVGSAVMSTVSTITNGIKSVLGLSEQLTDTKKGIASSVIAGGAEIAGTQSAVPMAPGAFASNKQANIQIGNIAVKSATGDNPTNASMAGDIGASVQRNVVLALQQAGSELG